MLQSGHGGKLHSQQERKVAPFTVSITFVITVERAKVAKCTAQNHKNKITVLELAKKFGKNANISHIQDIVASHLCS